MNMVAIVFWVNAVAIAAIGVGVIYTVVRDFLTNNQ